MPFFGIANFEQYLATLRDVRDQLGKIGIPLIVTSKPNIITDDLARLYFLRSNEKRIYVKVDARDPIAVVDDWYHMDDGPAALIYTAPLIACKGLEAGIRTQPRVMNERFMIFDYEPVSHITPL